ncbi:MAG: serine protein kinase [Deltaproteobacteria bacterium RIFOXYA12_FULL_58_15]|nr:MAG: serine protein kinase [Deltaproteobacteria bacterium RIFOXYA12_FULL_58_15]OGR13056.1 MAG: serine protein kinase [Deltaproteobacteria bacterium RIFOXYB12_FULL_58_9]
MVKDIRKAFVEGQTILSFPEFFNLMIEEPERHLRSTAQYLVDMLDHFGREQLDLPTGRVTRFKLFDAPFAGGEGRVAGQERVQEAIYRLLANFARQGQINKMLVLHGPNGSAKSSIVRCLMAGMEAYARLSEGAAYSFNWIIPSERLGSGSIGFGAGREAPKAAGESFAYLPADLIDARVPCDMHDHPVFLIPRGLRRSLLNELLPEASTGTNNLDQPHTTISDYLRFGDLCYKCRRIYDALLASYDGDVSKVLDHIQVERFYVSKRYRRGAATIEPQLSVDARIQQVTADRSMQSLPKSLQYISLYEPSGPLVDANRGLLEFSDLLKRPVDAFKYLLDTIETATVSMDSFVLQLDVAFIGSTNEIYLEAFKEHPDFPSFKGRMELVKVPYLNRYADEKQIYEPQINARVVGRHVAPHAIDVASLWAILSRMRRCDSSRYDDELKGIIDDITPMEKLRLYDTGAVPERLSAGQAKELHKAIPDLFKESVSYPQYEGRLGASAREIRTALLNAAHHADYKCLSPLAVFEQLRELLESKSIYEFLKQDKMGKYHDHQAFLEQTEELFTRWVDVEVRESMGLATEGSYSEPFERYIRHVSQWVKKEKVRDPTSGALHDPDEKLMAEIEKVLKADGESAEDFRRSVIGTIGARALENPDFKADYAVIFKPYFERLREDFFASRQKILRRLNINFLKFTSGDKQDGLEPKEREHATAMLECLESRYGYCRNCARDTVAYLLSKRYGE